MAVLVRARLSRLIWARFVLLHSAQCARCASTAVARAGRSTCVPSTVTRWPRSTLWCSVCAARGVRGRRRCRSCSGCTRTGSRTVSPSWRSWGSQPDAQREARHPRIVGLGCLRDRGGAGIAPSTRDQAPGALRGRDGSAADAGPAGRQPSQCTTALPAHPGKRHPRSVWSQGAPSAHDQSRTTDQLEAGNSGKGR
jgi:hypothetical protein